MKIIKLYGIEDTVYRITKIVKSNRLNHSNKNRLFFFWLQKKFIHQILIHFVDFLEETINLKFSFQF